VPLKLPELDDRSWKDLTDEGHLLIPTFSPGWTNHNVSDPGITLIELFAYYCESFLYRINQISDANIRSFLKLINGPDWQPGLDTGKDIRDTLLDLRRVHRAVSAEDFESLALEMNAQLGPDAPVSIARAKCLPRRNLEIGRKPSSTDAPGHVSIVIVPDPVEADTEALLRSLKRALEPARLLATRVHVVLPRYLRVAVQVSVTPERHVPNEKVRESVLETIHAFFDPLRGGFEGRGWAFGRNVYVSEIYEVIAKVPGVGSVARISRAGKLQDELIVDPAASDRVRRNRLGELEAIELEPNELVRANFEESQIVFTSGWETRPHDSP